MTVRWRRVTKQAPCPICQRTSYCTIAPDGKAAKCMRVASPHPVAGGGHWHRIDGTAPLPPSREEQPRLSPAELALMARRFEADMTDRRFDATKRSLGLSGTALRFLCIGWSHEHRACAFPMRDAMLRIVGIRLRTANGRKFAATGSREGLFIPAGLPLDQYDEPPIFCEGPTSMAALLDLGFYAVGRPSCLSGVELSIQWIRRNKLASVVIFGDRDEAKRLPDGRTFHPGQDGAAAFAKACVEAGVSCRVVIPPVKDARQWLNEGATHAAVAAVIRRAPIYIARKGRAA